MALYEESDYRFVLLVCKKFTGGVAFNAAGHALAGLMAKMQASETPPFLDYPAANGDFATIAKHPVICLAADNGNQLRATFEQACAAGIAVNPFVEAMIGPSADAQQEATAAVAVDQHSFIALAMFGAAESMKPLTKRFSLMKSEQPAEKAVVA